MRRLLVGAAVLALAASPAAGPFTQQGDKLTGLGAVGSAYQGGTVALSADGNTALVGGASDSDGVGAVWVFTRSGGAWTRQGEKLVGTGAVGKAYQGHSLALSADGNTALVGGLYDSSRLGAVWVFTRSAGGWMQQGEKLVAAGAPEGAQQGHSVALSADGNTALVGGPGKPGWGWTEVGSAWVFVRSDGVWAQQGAMPVPAGATGTRVGFGAAVALSADGNTAVVGGEGDDDYAGAAWVFTRAGGVWAQQGPKLVGTGAAGDAGQGSDVGISADGNTVLVGGASDDGSVGAAWVFTRSGGVWTQQGAKLVGTGVTGSLDPFSAWTAFALSGDGNTALAGRGIVDGESGAAWAFTRSGGTWTQLGERFAGAGALGNSWQGSDVALSADGTTAIVGGSGDQDGVGAAWVFTRQGPALWVPVVVHESGRYGSEWRSDLGLLNAGARRADVELVFHGPDGTVTGTTYVPAGAQAVLVDVVGQLPASGQGALEVIADQPVVVTARTYSQAPGDAACAPGGTNGHGYPALAAGEGLAEGQTAWLPHLVESPAYRTNIGLVNTGTGAAKAMVELFDGAGRLLASHAVSLAPGEWQQELQPFRTWASPAALDRGYARVTVTSGSGVSAFASVVDNVTNDPTTITMRR